MSKYMSDARGEFPKKRTTAGYERCDPCAKVYYWSYGDWWPLPIRLS